MISVNFITGPNTPTPLNLVNVAQNALSGIPAKLRRRALHILPRRIKPTSVMQFDYPTQMAPGVDEQDELAACRNIGAPLGIIADLILAQ